MQEVFEAVATNGTHFLSFHQINNPPVISPCCVEFNQPLQSLLIKVLVAEASGCVLLRDKDFLFQNAEAGAVAHVLQQRQGLVRVVTL